MEKGEYIGWTLEEIDADRQRYEAKLRAEKEAHENLVRR